MRISSWLTMCSRVLVRWGGMLLSGDWAWPGGKDWGKSSVRLCWVVEGLVLGKWVVLLLLPLHGGATMWSSGSLETWEHNSISFNNNSESHIFFHILFLSISSSSKAHFRSFYLYPKSKVKHIQNHLFRCCHISTKGCHLLASCCVWTCESQDSNF